MAVVVMVVRTMKNMKNAVSRLFSTSMWCTRYTQPLLVITSRRCYRRFSSAAPWSEHTSYASGGEWMKRMLEREREETRALIPVRNNYTAYKFTHRVRYRQALALQPARNEWNSLRIMTTTDEEYGKMGIRRQSHPSTREQWCAIN